MNTIVKAAAAPDFLALVPQLVGFVPERSLVLVAFRGNRTCGAFRLDLPCAGGPPARKRVANTLIGMLCKIREADALVPVVYTDDSFSAVGGAPHAELAGALVDRARLGGFLVREALCVASDAWGSYLDEDGPADGRPLADIARSPVAASLPLRGGTALESPEARARLPRADLAARERVARALRDPQRMPGVRRAGDDEGRGDGDGEAGFLFDPLGLTEDSLSWNVDELDPGKVAVLLLLLQSPPTRDQMMLQYAFGREAGEAALACNRRYAALQRATGQSMDELVAAEVDAGLRAIDESVGDLMLGRTGERPDVGRVERAIALLKAVVVLAPRRARPAPLCMLAWLSWALGRGSVAGIFVDRVASIDAGYGMGQVLAALFDTGHLPEWAFTEAGAP